MDQLLVHAESVGHRFRRGCVPSPINPTDNVATESKRIGCITQPTLSTFEHGTLVHEVVEHFATLGEKVVQPRLGAFYETVFMECIVLPTSAQHPVTEGVFRRLGRRSAFWRNRRGEASAGIGGKGRADARGEELCALCRGTLR